ncbi:unnamed protein product [Taenia asiatica]|uniref:Uncharacterized protein n=1 Tax=Taenia asiatica TaxID=60517 RepID=A0A0R3VYI2_TAEAS|nr:unnamed protein product [Taenia asiatica]
MLSVHSIVLYCCRRGWTTGGLQSHPALLIPSENEPCVYACPLTTSEVSEKTPLVVEAKKRGGRVESDYEVFNLPVELATSEGDGHGSHVIRSHHYNRVHLGREGSKWSDPTLNPCSGPLDANVGALDA